MKLRLPMIAAVTFVLMASVLVLATQLENDALATLMWTTAANGKLVLTGSNQAPIASFTYSPEIPAPEESIVFNASSSYDPDGWIVQYGWDFGDGNVTTTTNPIITHAYPIDGSYTVELTVTDNNAATGAASAVIEISTEVFFRVCFAGSLIPMSNVEVTMYYKSGSSWVKAPVGSCLLELRYDNMTQPYLADTPAEKYRNPGFTASILRKNASNIGFDIHPSCWTVFFKFKWGDVVAYWPNDTTRVYTYRYGAVESHDYILGYGAYWDATAGTYVIKAKHIPGSGVSPTQNHPIIIGLLCPPPPQRYYLTVKTDPAGITTIPGEGWYVQGTNVALTAPEYVNVSDNTRYKFSYWDVNGTSRGSGINPITVQMNANYTATAHYIPQYCVTFAQTGLSPDANGTVVTVDGVPKFFGDLPFNKWVNNGSTVAYSYSSNVSSSASGKRYRLNSVSGPSSPITVTGPTTVTGNYVTQYLVTFAQTGLDSTANSTVVTVNGVPKFYTDLPYSDWFDSGSTVNYSYSSTVSSTVSGKRFKLVAVNCPPSQFIVNGPVTVTGQYCTQYKVTFEHSGLDSTATGPVVTVNGSAKAYADLPYFLWVNSSSSVTYDYNDIVLSNVTGKRFNLTGVSGPASPITVTGPVTVIGNYKIQYKVTFDQTGVASDFTDTVVTIDGVNYNVTALPTLFWWNKDSTHNFSFASPLVVDATKQYNWSSASGLSSLQSGNLTITTSGSVTGNYIVTNRITFDQVGVSSDFTGTVVVIDGASYGVGSLPVSFLWEIGSTHNFSFQSPLVVAANAKQYVWTSTTGLSTLQNGSIAVTVYGSIVGNYKTQYYLTLATNPPGVTSPSGAGWYDAETYASISTASIMDIVPGSSRHSFSSWTTGDMAEITNASAPATTVFMDKAKTVTANYVTQYCVTFSQSGVGSDFTGTVVTIDGNEHNVSALPKSFWWDNNSYHTFSFSSPLVVNASRQYVWLSTTGLSTLRNGNLTITGSGSVTGNYAVLTQCQITFRQTGVGSDFTGTVVTIDGVDYNVTSLPVSFWWDVGSVHNFSYQSPLVVASYTKQFIWTSTTGLSTLQNGSITVSTFGGVVGNYNTQYYLTLATSPPGVDSPSGAGWYDEGVNASISTDAFVNIVSGCSRYRFNGWTTDDMAEIADPTRSPTTVLMDKAKTVTANYVIQYNVTFNQSVVGSDFTSTVVEIDDRDYNVTQLPYWFWWDVNSTHAFAYQSPLVVAINAKQYVWTSTSGLSTSQSGSITISACGSVTGNYKTQYYLTVSSPYGSPTPTSRWYDSGTPVTASVTSPVSGPPRTRYVCTGWSGTGSVPPSGTSTTVSFTINQPSNITWNWKTQYLLDVATDPAGLSPQPTRSPPGEPEGSWWYDAATSVNLTAQTVTGYTFSYWNVDGASQSSGVNPITVSMSAPHNATAHYALIAPPPSLSINPLSASIYVGQSVFFTSSVSGGTAPYGYQWYLNGLPVSGANSSSWIFTPPTSGVYYVYLIVTDASHNTVQSETARITVMPVPVGGYTVSLTKQTPPSHIAVYTTLIVLFAAALSLTKRKRK